MSCSCDSLCLVDEGRGRRSLRWAISELIMSRRILLAPLVDLVGPPLPDVVVPPVNEIIKVVGRNREAKANFLNCVYFTSRWRGCWSGCVCWTDRSPIQTRTTVTATTAVKTEKINSRHLNFLAIFDFKILITYPSIQSRQRSTSP